MKDLKEKADLNEARALELPKREDTLRRDHTVHKFWKDNRDLLERAWKQWEELEGSGLSHLDHSVIDNQLQSLVHDAWLDPKKESAVRDLIEEISPGVYQFQFFSPEKLESLRQFLDQVSEAKIPLRAPYGIVLNRKGAMLDRRSEGYLAAPSFQSLYQEILDTYMRPIARLLFPEIFGYDTQSFGFSIQYQPEKDTFIRLHTDASSVTLNINLNLPNEDFSGSEVDFHNPSTGQLTRATFKSGMAIIHKGSVAHAAQPIRSGTRTNLVLWLYGDQMQVSRERNMAIEIAPEVRWSRPQEKNDGFAPF